MPCCQTKEVKNSDLETKIRNSTILKKLPTVDRKSMLSEELSQKKADQLILFDDDDLDSDTEADKMRISAANEQTGVNTIHMSVSSLIIKSGKKKENNENVVTMQSID